MQELLLDLQSSGKARWLHSSCHHHCIHNFLLLSLSFLSLSRTRTTSSECVYFFLWPYVDAPPHLTLELNHLKAVYNMSARRHGLFIMFLCRSVTFIRRLSHDMARHGPGSHARYRRVGRVGCAQTVKRASLVHLSCQGTSGDSICSTLTSDQLCKNNTLTRVTPPGDSDWNAQSLLNA